MPSCIIYFEGKKIANKENQEIVATVQVGKYNRLDIGKEGTDSQGKN